MLKSKIESQYKKHSCLRISQGDILRDLEIVVLGENINELIPLKFPYLIVLSQDCDLVAGNDLPSEDLESKDSCISFHQFLPSILLIPAFSAEFVKSGEHLSSLYNIKEQHIPKKIWDQVLKNAEPRYHFLKPDTEGQIPELVIDFKAYYTLSYQYFLSKHKEHYLATINELFREHLSQRFSNYLNRIGLPEIPKPEIEK